MGFKRKGGECRAGRIPPSSPLTAPLVPGVLKQLRFVISCLGKSWVSRFDYY